jgi:hypothetical protein
MRIRLPYLSLGLIAAIAACGKPDPVANGANAITSVPSTTTNAPAPAGGPPEIASSTTESTPSAKPLIPTALQGRWGLTPGDCTSALGDAKGLLVINSRELRFYESRAVPSPGVTVDRDSMTGNFAFTGEGERWTRFENFELRNHALVRTESNPAASYSYAK